MESLILLLARRFNLSSKLQDFFMVWLAIPRWFRFEKSSDLPIRILPRFKWPPRIKRTSGSQHLQRVLLDFCSLWMTMGVMWLITWQWCFLCFYCGRSLKQIWAPWWTGGFPTTLPNSAETFHVLSFDVLPASLWECNRAGKSSCLIVKSLRGRGDIPS